MPDGSGAVVVSAGERHWDAGRNPVRQGGGWLIGRLNLEELWRMVDRIKVGQNGFALVVLSDGRLLAHGDPGDHFLVATAKVLGLTLVTSDERIIRAADVPVLANR